VGKCVAAIQAALFFVASASAQTSEKKTMNVSLTVDCADTVGSNAASALRETIRGSNGYSLSLGPTKGHSGYEILLTCAAIPGHETVLRQCPMSSMSS
jgi:hypothetical protein